MDYSSSLLFMLMIIFWFGNVTAARFPSMRHHKYKRNSVGERSVLLTIARELLSHVVQSTKEKRDVDENSVVVDMAREGVTLGLMAYMAFEQEDECIERLVCDVTERLSQMSDSTMIFLTAADFVIPEEYKSLVGVARDTANGSPCYYYKCGALQYHSDDDTDADTER